MDDQTLARIKGDSNYQTLVRERSSFGWTLAIVTLVLYYGYIGIVAFAPGVIAIKLTGAITLGLVMGVALIAISIILTGLYVMRANSRYDDLTRAVVNSVTGGGK